MLLCLDPGYSNFGCSIIDHYGTVIDVGTIKTKKAKTKLLRVADDDVQRITYISTKLSEVIKHHQIKGVLSELPPSASKSAAGAKGLGIAVAIAVTLFAELNVPVEWATPDEVKRAMTGKKNASKEDMMAAACKKYGWDITYKNIYKKNTHKLQRRDSIYHPVGKTMGKNRFEHIADSLGAFEALKHTNVARLYLKAA